MISCSAMDLHSIVAHSTTTLSTLACLLTFLFLIITFSKKRSASPSPPEPAGSLPIIGHLLLLRGKETLHKALARLADQYGPIFKIRLGMRQVVVVSNSEMAKECLLTNNKDFASRPSLISYELLTYNYAIFPFAPYGPYWRETRRICTHELLSNQRLPSILQNQVAEVRAAIKDGYDKWVVTENNQGMKSRGATAGGYGGVVEMKEWFVNVNMNMIMHEVVGKSFRKYSNMEEANRFLNVLQEFFHLNGVFTMADAFPYLRYLNIGGYEKMRKTAKELDYFAQTWLESHRIEERDVQRVDLKRDFMDILIDIYCKGDARTFNYDADTIIKATSLTMILGASGTTSMTLTWALCLLLNNPRTMKKVREELDTHVGRERMLIESDLSNLVYLQAVIKETLRLYPPAPLLAPHESTADVVVGGYHIAAGTMLFLNVQKIHQDPLIWEDPFMFHPERFLTAENHIDLRGHHFELIPFSSGRRVCPGISYALQMMHFTLASLLHCFEITTLSSGLVDMTESEVIANLKANCIKAAPLEVLLIPRLPHHLYDEIAD